MTISNNMISDTKAPPLPATDHLDGVAYLFGAPIAHSMSPILHGTVYEGLGLNWQQFLLESLDIPMFLQLIRQSKCFGICHACISGVEWYTNIDQEPL